MVPEFKTLMIACVLGAIFLGILHLHNKYMEVFRLYHQCPKCKNILQAVFILDTGFRRKNVRCCGAEVSKIVVAHWINGDWKLLNCSLQSNDTMGE